MYFYLYRGDKLTISMRAYYNIKPTDWSRNVMIIPLFTPGPYQIDPFLVAKTDWSFAINSNPPFFNPRFLRHVLGAKFRPRRLAGSIYQ
jgi:hypothetical protein